MQCPRFFTPATVALITTFASTTCSLSETKQPRGDGPFHGTQQRRRRRGPSLARDGNDRVTLPSAWVIARIAGRAQ